MQSNPYIVLGVPPDVSAQELKAHYRWLCRSMHPDVNPEPGVADEFKRITAAYDQVTAPGFVWTPGEPPPDPSTYEDEWVQADGADYTATPPRPARAGGWRSWPRWARVLWIVVCCIVGPVVAVVGLIVVMLAVASYIQDPARTAQRSRGVPSHEWF